MIHNPRHSDVYMYKIHNITIQVPHDCPVITRKGIRVRKCKDVTQVFNLKDTHQIQSFEYVSVMSSSHIKCLCGNSNGDIDLYTLCEHITDYIAKQDHITDVYYRPYTKVYALNIRTCFGSALLYKSGSIVMYTKSTHDILYLLCVLKEATLGFLFSEC